MTEIWQTFLAIVREEVGSRVVETWFKSVIFVRWDTHAKIAYLQAPNQFIKEWINSHYLELFQKHLSRLLSEQTVRVSFVEQTGQQQNMSPMVVPSIIPSAAPTPTKPLTYVPARHIVPVSEDYKGGGTSRPRTTMNPIYQFDTFVVGPSNSLAYAAAKAVAEKPGKLYNPFFIYGPSGLGKTHLLHAIGNHIKLHHKKAIVLYQTADRFVAEFIAAIRFDKIYNFESKYKDVDVLLVDDIQFISNKEQTQEAFFHIFNTLHQSQKQIVFTSDSMPKDIAGLAERMRSRLEWGLVADISIPALETKIAIIKKKAEVQHADISDAVAQAIAERVVSNIRELEGALIRLLAYALLMRRPIDVELVEQVLGPIARPEIAKPLTLNLQRIATIVGRHFNYSIQDLRSTKRDKNISFARHVTLFL
jgi:chromosomal replication initiator protein DnaA